MTIFRIQHKRLMHTTIHPDMLTHTHRNIKVTVLKAKFVIDIKHLKEIEKKMIYKKSMKGQEKKNLIKIRKSTKKKKVLKEVILKLTITTLRCK